jgi:hypothetical protein
MEPRLSIFSGVSIIRLEERSDEFASARDMGVLQGSAPLWLSEGRLFLEGLGGRPATCTPNTENDRRLMWADAVTEAGRQLTADPIPKA